MPQQKGYHLHNIDTAVLRRAHRRAALEDKSLAQVMRDIIRVYAESEDRPLLKELLARADALNEAPK